MHPNFAFSLAHTWSKSGHKSKGGNFISAEKEILFGYCQKQQTTNPVNYYVFGHRHFPLELKVDEKATYINTGDWLQHYTYAVLDNEKLELKTYNK
jgi:UDP-2,3-diacylglucosamine hydrolase